MSYQNKVIENLNLCSNTYAWNFTCHSPSLLIQKRARRVEDSGTDPSGTGATESQPQPASSHSTSAHPSSFHPSTSSKQRSRGKPTNIVDFEELLGQLE